MSVFGTHLIAELSECNLEDITIESARNIVLDTIKAGSGNILIINSERFKDSIAVLSFFIQGNALIYFHPQEQCVSVDFLSFDEASNPYKMLEFLSISVKSQNVFVDKIVRLNDRHLYNSEYNPRVSLISEIKV